MEESALQQNNSLISFEPFADHLKLLYQDGKIRTDIDNFEYIRTIKYKQRLLELTKHLPEEFGFKYYTICFNFQEREKFFLSNDPGNITIPYEVLRMERFDGLYSLIGRQKTDHFFPTLEDDILQRSFIKYIQDVYQIYPIYNLVRRCDTCTVIVGIENNSPIVDPKATYQRTVTQVENFTLRFIEQTLDILAGFKPNLKYLRIFSDAQYRHTIIKNRDQKKTSFLYQKLNDKERACLQLYAQKFTVEEIGKKVFLSDKTVRDYLANCRAAFGTNITNTVSEAIRSGIID